MKKSQLCFDRSPKVFLPSKVDHRPDCLGWGRLPVSVMLVILAA
jgi:hypothetical protein